MVEMNAAETFVHNTLDMLHYAKPGYDPQKAHDYYERNKKLKGRKAASGPNKGLVNQPNPKDAKGPEHTTNRARVNSLVTRSTGKVGAKRSAAIEELSAQAKTKLGKLTNDLRTWVESNTRDIEAQKAKIDADIKAKIAALPKLPARANAVQKEARTRKIAQIQGEATTKKSAVDASVKTKFDAKKKEISASKEQVMNDLRESIGKIVGTTKTSNAPQTATESRHH